MPAMAFTAEPDGSCTFVNRRWVDYTGQEVETAAGTGWQAVVHPDDLDRVVNKVAVPLSYADELYALRNNIYAVRKRVMANSPDGDQGAPAVSPRSA